MLVSTPERKKKRRRRTHKESKREMICVCTRDIGRVFYGSTHNSMEELYSAWSINTKKKFARETKTQTLCILYL